MRIEPVGQQEVDGALAVVRRVLREHGHCNEEQKGKGAKLSHDFYLVGAVNCATLFWAAFRTLPAQFREALATQQLIKEDLTPEYSLATIKLRP